MDGTTAVTAFSSVLASTPKLAENGFDICAVDEQAKGLLQTVQQVAGQLDDAKSLRQKKSALFTASEKRTFDDSFRHTEDAIRHVAALAERPQADMEVSGGKMRVNTRVLFVLRDSPNIQQSLTQLGLASQDLNSTFVQLSSRDEKSGSPATSNSSPPLQQEEAKPSPTYEESQFLSQGRRRNIKRRESALALINGATNERQRPYSSLSLPTQRVMAIPEVSIPELPGDEYYRRVSTGSFLPDLSIPEAVLQLKQAQEDNFGLPLPPLNGYAHSSPLSRRLRSDGAKTGRARTRSWLEARCQ